MTKVSSITPEVVQIIKKHWFDRTGLFIVVIVFWAIETPFLMKESVPIWYSPVTFIVPAFLIYIAWSYSKKTPKIQKNKIDFVVSIACDDEEGKKLKEDFVIPLRQMARSGKTGNAFQFIEFGSASC